MPVGRELPEPWRCSYVLNCVYVAGGVHNPALQCHHPQEDGGALSSLQSLRDLPSHIKAAGVLVRQLQLPDKYPAHPFAFLGTDPLKFATGAEARSNAEALCDEMVGEAFLQRWHAAEKHFCSDSRGSGGLGSDVKCYVAPEHAPERPLTACVATNLLLTSSSAFMGEMNDEIIALKQSVPPTKVLFPSFVYKLPRPEPASIKVACTAAAVNKSATIVPNTTANGAAGYVMVDHVAQWLVAGLQDKQYEAVQQACGSGSASVIEHPVLFVTRIGATNIFHAMEDLIVALSFLAAHNAPVANGMQVVFTNQDPSSPFALEELWSLISTAGPVRYLRSDPFPANTCFKTANIVPIGFKSSLLSMATDRQMLCRSAMAIGLSSWLRAVSSSPVEPAQHPTTTFAAKARPLDPLCSQPSCEPVQRLKILFLARHKWVAPASPGHNLTSYEKWQLARDLLNEEELVRTVKATAHAWNRGVCAYQQAASGKQEPNCRNARATFDVVVHAHHHHHGLSRQLEDSITASIIVGVHGAGLTHAFFMPPGGAVLEIMPLLGNSHYLSIANMMGHGYKRSNYHIPDRRANVADAKAKLLQLMGKLGACRD